MNVLSRILTDVVDYGRICSFPERSKVGGLVLKGIYLSNNLLRRAFKGFQDATVDRLQCLLYLTCHEFFKRTGMRLIEDSFVLTSEGPRLEEVAFEFGEFKEMHIDRYFYDRKLDHKSYFANEKQTINGIKLEKIIDDVWVRYMHMRDDEIQLLAKHAFVNISGIVDNKAAASAVAV